MKLIDAINILNPKSGNIDDLTAAYTANKENPDAEKAFNTLWEAGEVLVNNAIIKTDDDRDDLKAKRDDRDRKIQEHIESIIDKIKDIPGIDAEICGRWLWVSGSTKEHANMLKSAGLRWARQKQKWYWRPADARRKRGGKPWHMQKIRETYGSEDIKAA